MGSKFNEIFSDRSQGKPSTMLSARSTVSSFDDIPFNQHAAFLSGLGDPTELDETKIKRAEIEERLLWSALFVAIYWEWKTDN